MLLLLERQEETERSHVVFPPYMGTIFSKKSFHWEGHFWTNLSETKLKVHWCVNGDVGSQFDLGLSLLKRFAWEDLGQEETMVSCHSCSLETMGLSNSSNINEGIRAVLFFKRKDFARTKSAKSTKRKQATFTQMFFMRTKNAKSTKSTKSIKRTKSTKRQTSNLLPLRCFLCAQKCCLLYFCSLR